MKKWEITVRMNVDLSNQGPSAGEPRNAELMVFTQRQMVKASEGGRVKRVKGEG